MLSRLLGVKAQHKGEATLVYKDTGLTTVSRDGTWPLSVLLGVSRLPRPAEGSTELKATASLHPLRSFCPQGSLLLPQNRGHRAKE